MIKQKEYAGAARPHTLFRKTLPGEFLDKPEFGCIICIINLINILELQYVDLHVSEAGFVAAASQ